MWRLKSFSGNEDSDQSISDEDDERDNAWPDNVVSLAGTLKPKKESLGIASKLDLLKGAHQDVGLSSDDEVEAPDFHDHSNLDFQFNVERDSVSSRRDDSVCESDKWTLGIKKGSKMLFKSTTSEGSLSEALNLCNRGKENMSETCTLSGIDAEASTPHRWSETGRSGAHHPFHTNDLYPYMGGEEKTKATPLSNLKPLKKDDFWSLLQINKDPNSASSDELPDDTEANEQWPKGNSEHLGGYENMVESRFASSKAGEVQFDRSTCSMADLLDHLQGKKSETYLNSIKGPRRKESHGQHAGAISSGYNILNDEDADEFMHSKSSTDNEEAAQNPELPIVESERKTMADKFQEAFGSAPVDNRFSFTVQKHSSIGLFGRLQKAMQWQKEQDSEFLKMIQTEVWPKDEGRYLDVKILSRSFDAKLTVCHCSLLENEESSPQNLHQENFGKTWTIIFSPRVCGDVDLDVGKLIRIHPPWKEVQVLGGEIIILTTYFSQI